MSIQLFLVGMICILSLAFICMGVNWKSETSDFVNLFKKKVRETTDKR